MAALRQSVPPNRQPASPERARPQLDRLPRPVLARVETLAAGSWTAPHRHRWGQLSYAVQGVLRVGTAAGSFIAPPQRAVWVPAGVEHAVQTGASAEMRSLYIDAAGLPADCRVLGVTPLVRELILAVCALPEHYDEAGAEGRLVAVLLDQLAQLQPVALDLPLPTDARLQRLCAALQADPADQRTWAQWGHEVGLSERSLVRLFQRQTGLAPGVWRRRLRLLLALSPLAAGAKVSAVAADCGYASVSAFIVAFSAEFGVTPAQMFAS
jgi:AraC-like DNA-binding protein/quercetin dioxygenase-like cupin family protein